MQELFEGRATALHKDIKVIIGDYPYAACNSYKEEPNTPARWYQVPCEFAVILIPENYSDKQKVYSFLHELGHVNDFINGIEFESPFDNEISAWKYAYKNLPDQLNGIILHRTDFKTHCLDCLSTYDKKCLQNMFQVWQAIKGH